MGIPWRLAGGILFMALSINHAGAFDFTPDNRPVSTVDVEEKFVGDTWARATIESWQISRNTVWAHCEAVLQSYGTYSIGDIIRCREDVSAANGVTESSLSLLHVGDTLILPLTKEESEKFTAATLNPSETEVTTREALTNELRDITTSLRSLEGGSTEINASLETLSSDVNESRETLGSRLDTLEARIVSTEEDVKRLLERGVEFRPSIIGPGEAERVAETTLPVDERVAEIRVLEELFAKWWWVLAIFAALILGLIVLNTITLVRMGKLRKQHRLDEKALEKMAGQLDEEWKRNDFTYKPYDFDGVTHTIQLIKIDQSGRYYKTPFGTDVKEENLKSHFAHATRKLKEAA